MTRKNLALCLCLCLGVGVALSGVVQAADAQSLYAKCIGCHGADGSKKSLGTGKPIKGMSAQEVAKDLLAYKAKTRAGDKKAIMEAQAAALSEQDIQALAEYIAKF